MWYVYKYYFLYTGVIIGVSEIFFWEYVGYFWPIAICLFVLYIIVEYEGFYFQELFDIFAEKLIFEGRLQLTEQEKHLLFYRSPSFLAPYYFVGTQSFSPKWGWDDKISDKYFMWRMMGLSPKEMQKILSLNKMVPLGLGLILGVAICQQRNYDYTFGILVIFVATFMVYFLLTFFQRHRCSGAGKDMGVAPVLGIMAILLFLFAFSKANSEETPSYRRNRKPKRPVRFYSEPAWRDLRGFHFKGKTEFREGFTGKITERQLEIYYCSIVSKLNALKIQPIEIWQVWAKSYYGHLWKE